jgi:hypothetical protein
MTTPLPALAENRNPALKMVNIANPLAFCSTALGITPSRPLFPLSTNDLTREIENCTLVAQIRKMGYLHIFAALVHSLARGCGRGLLSFMVCGRDYY